MSNSFFQQNGIPNFPIQFMTRPNDGDVLTYSTEKGCWINQAGGGGGSDATAIQGIAVDEGPYNDGGPLAFINSDPPKFSVVSSIAIDEITSNGESFFIIGLNSEVSSGGSIELAAGTTTSTDISTAGGSVSLLAGLAASPERNGVVSLLNADGESIIQAGNDSSSNPALCFFDSLLVEKQSVTGSRGGNAALASLLTALANYGLIINNTTA